MKKRNLLFAIILLMMTACENKQQTSDVVEIHPDKFVETEMKLTDIAEELEYIQLDNTRLMRSWQIKMTDKYIFVAARDELLQFDRKGTFIKTIGSKGQGPGEFLSCTNIALDAEGERIFVRNGSQALTYSFDGKFLGKMELPLVGMVDIAYAKGNLYGISMVSFTQEQLPHLWMKTDSRSGEVLQEKANTGIEFDTDEMTLRCNYTCASTDGTILYYNHLNDTIFRLGNAQDETAYLFGQGDFRLTPKNMQHAEYHLELKDIWDSDRYLFVDYRMEKKRQLCIYDKQTGTFSNDTDGEIMNDMDGILPFKFHSTHFVGTESYMMQIVSAEDMKEALLASDDPKLKAWGEKMLFDDNDILVLAKLRKSDVSNILPKR